MISDRKELYFLNQNQSKYVKKKTKIYNIRYLNCLKHLFWFVINDENK